MMKNLIWIGLGVGIGTVVPGLIPSSQQSDKPQTVRDFPNLAAGLQATPGCLGVQTFRVDGTAKQVIAAWFENRKAMEAWYYGTMHQDAMKKFFPGYSSDRKPFADFKDEKSPLLIVASVTPGDRPIGNGSNLHVAQIAIEGYSPIPGGVAFGGSFGPKELAVPGMIRVP
ncbi:MAG TPA: antibiotic biosynthesis monooxygenase [Fimbriimonadaceae bacterium]|nr:antibiotic biosynthesis monooxygenase [Fimbriimonadaceae bacterium]